MNTTPQELGRRIRAAREACRLTQDEVAKHLQVSRPTVGQIEGGNRSVSSLELGKLAFLFGRDLREFLADSFDEEDALAVLFRAQAPAIDQPEMLDKLRECMAIARELTNLERLVGIDRNLTAVPAYRLAAPKSRWEAIQQAEGLAEAERRRLDLGNAPLADVVALLESQGIRTGMVDFPDDVSGLTLSDRGIGHFVVANRQHHDLRRRFSFAHEYAHVLADRDRRGWISRASERDQLAEVRANTFAASFLMPEEGVRQFVAGLGKGKPSRAAVEVYDEGGSLSVEGRTEAGTQTLQLYDVVQLAQHFAVSRLSALYRLRNLRLLTESELEGLKLHEKAGKGKQLARLLGFREPDPAERRGEFHRRFLGLALEAYRRDEISTGKLRELAAMAGLSQDDLDALLEDAGIDGELA